MSLNKLNSVFLDCTIRDGGYVNNWNFTMDQVRQCYIAVKCAGYEYMEIGFRDNLKIYRDHVVSKWKKCTDDIVYELNDIYSDETKLAVMVNYDNSEISDFAKKEDSLISLVRIAANRFSVLDACNYGKQIKSLGYKVSVNAMGISTYTDDEIKVLCEKIICNDIDYLYIADSYGSIDEIQLKTIINRIRLNFSQIDSTYEYKLGYHGHNNTQRGLSNALVSIQNDIDIIDSTMFGMGRGAGNVCTELLISDLCRKYPEKFNSDKHLLPCLKFVSKYLCPQQAKIEKDVPWGYNIPYLISGHLECHPNYAMKMIEYGITDIEIIWKVTKKIVTDGKHNVFDRTYLESTLNEFIV